MSLRDPKPVTDEGKALLRVAERDWKTFQLLKQHPDAPSSSLCFHAQQYVEKVMKAVLVCNAVIFRRTHDLEELGDLLEQRGIDLPLSRDQLRHLNPFAVLLRYEDLEMPSIDINVVADMVINTRKWVGCQIRV